MHRKSRNTPLLALAGLLALFALLGTLSRDTRNAPAASTELPPTVDKPPLFSDGSRSRTVAALVTGAPDAVTLTVHRSGSTSGVRMVQQPDGHWTAPIPGSNAGGPGSNANADYEVVATYGRSSLRSPSYHLEHLAQLRTSIPMLSGLPGTQILSASLGNGPDELGIRGGSASATELPAAFAVDDRTLVVLDSVKSRVVTFDRAGRRMDTAALASTTGSDIVLGDGSAFVLDQTRDQITQISGGSRRVFGSLSIRTTSAPHLAYDTSRHALYVGDAAQGRQTPVVENGSAVSSADRAKRTRRGQPTRDGELAVEVEPHSVTFGLMGSSSSGLRIDLSDEVLDVSEAVVDGQGTLWALVGTYAKTTDSASTLLLRIDPKNGSSRSEPVGTSVPGDVTRRLAPAARGVVVLEGDRQALRYVRYSAL